MFGRLEASYEFDTLRLLSLGGNLWHGNSTNLSDMAVEMFKTEGDLVYSYKNDGESKFNYGSAGINLDYQRSTRKKDENITLSYRFSHNPDDNESRTYARDIKGDMPLYIRPSQRYDSDAKTVEHTGQIDYTNPITKKHSIEAGVKYILRQNISNVKQYEWDNNGQDWHQLPSTMNNDFEHISNIYAGYAGYSFKGTKAGFRTGLRAEGTKQEVQFKFAPQNNFDVDYFNLVPSVTASYQLKPTQQLRAGYNLRISRPSIWYLNPYVNDTDPYNISYGNPELKPEKSNSFNLNYSYFSPKYTLNVNATYSYVNNSIESYTYIDTASPEVKRQTYGNIGSSQRTGIYVNSGWTPTPKLRINFNGGVNYADMKANNDGLNTSNSGLTGNCYINAQITLPKDFRINAGGMYMSGWVMLQGKQSSYYFVNFSANKDFLKKKLTVSLSCSNPFTKYLKIEMDTKNEGYFATHYKMLQPMREGRISISYRFGAMNEAIKKVQRSISNDDVKSGGGGGGEGGGVGM
jgi:outer membrane receptor protein involved in Fe transport